MKRDALWLMVSGLMALSLVMAACGPGAVEEKKQAPVAEEKKAAPAAEEKKQETPVTKEAVKPAPEAPRYGGTLNLVQSGDIAGWDDIVTRGATPGAVFRITNESMWAGDWVKGPAGGYGTNESDWTNNYDRFDQKAGLVAETTKWTVDTQKSEGTIIYQIRRGVRWALSPKSEASRLVGGREMTADDVVFSLKQQITDPRAYLYTRNPELKAARITKTGPWELTVKIPLEALMSAIGRFGNYGRIVPPEVVAKYGDMANWRNSVGTGPFMVTEYVAGSQAVLVRNPNYWMKDPVGPGKGNQLPYLDGYRHLIIPDKSTRLAALRTGKIDQMSELTWEDAVQLRKTSPALLEREAAMGSATATKMRSDKPPFNDVRVRRALMMATDFEAINQGLHGGRGQILTFPTVYNPTYADLYLSLDDPQMPASVRELYTYNPEKAKQLLKEAGYPAGLKTKALTVAADVDEYSIYKDMWAKVGIELEIRVMESGALNAVLTRKEHEGLGKSGGHPVANWYTLPGIYGTAVTNVAMIDDPIINEAFGKVNLAAITDEKEGMRLYKELMKHVLDQAWAIPQVVAPTYVFWWPWLKNYSGEVTIGYFMGDFWATFIWYDEALKKSMRF